MRPVFWANEARADFVSIIEFITKDNPYAAEQVGRSILVTAKNLGDFATGRPGRVVGTYEKTVSDLPYMISYAIDQEKIFVLRVIHGARHWPIGGWPQ